ncbi:UNVERIFIED_CONTAM: hypothetical protein Sindi_0317200 [Sesamum indicum]
MLQNRYSTNLSNDNVDSGKHGNDIGEIETSGVNCDSKMENDVHIDNTNCIAHDDNMPTMNSEVDQNSENSEEDQSSENSEEDQSSEEGEIMDSNARHLKIRDLICLTNCNPVDTESAEQLLQELTTPTRLPRNQFSMDEQSNYLLKNSEEKNRVMKQRSNSCGPRIRTLANQKKKAAETQNIMLLEEIVTM